MLNEKKLKRLKPIFTPEIYPIPEYLANDELLLKYTDMKTAFQVPWMGVVTMAFAHYPNFFNVLWDGFKDVAYSKEFVSECSSLRSFVENKVLDLDPINLKMCLEKKGYVETELNNIRGLLEIFSHGNMPYIMISSIARLLLEGHDLSTLRETLNYNGIHGVGVEKKLTLIESHHANNEINKIYNEIKSTLELPILNTDYRALARWPTYFSEAWNALKDKTKTPEYNKIIDEVHSFAVDQALRLPNPNYLNVEKLRSAALKDASIEEILSVVQLFQWLLPGLAINVAYFRQQLKY